jgi:hypothetical protein
MVPLFLRVSRGKELESAPLKGSKLGLNPSSRIYGDKAYTDYRFEEQLLKDEQIYSLPERKLNAKKQDSGCLNYIRN